MSAADTTEDRRDGESDATRYRSARVIHVNNAWFVTTRESIDVGPYETRDLAEESALRLSEMLDGISDPEIARQFIREYILLKDR